MADHKMKEPEKGKKPEKITTKNPPGGPQTPGAKRKLVALAFSKARANEEGGRISDKDVSNALKSGAEKNAAKAREENENGTFRSR